MQNFMKLRSQSYRTYYELVNKYQLNPTDYSVITFLIPKVKCSAKYGEHGRNGKCFNRHDNKIHGIYYATTLKKLINDFPFHIGRTALESSFDRLQNRYGLLYKSQTVRSDKNGIQIFLPVLDSDIRRYFHDDSYKTAINLKTKDGKKFGKRMSVRLHSELSFVRNWAYRSYGIRTNNNDHVMNNHVNNNHVCNDGHGSSQKQSNSSNNYKIKSFGLPKAIMNLICNHAKNKHEAISDVTIISRTKEDINKKFYYKDIKNGGYYSNEDNKFIQSDKLVQLVKYAFNHNKDLKKTISDTYCDYLLDQGLKLSNDKANKDLKLYSNFNATTYKDNCNSYYKLMKKYKGKNNNKYADAKKEFNKQVKLACRFTDLEPEYIKGTKEYNKATHLHPTSKAMQKKIKKQLDDLNNSNWNSKSKITVNSQVFKPTKPKKYYDLSKF